MVRNLPKKVIVHLTHIYTRQFNFKTGINYELRRKFRNNRILEPSKSIEDVKYFKNNDRFILFITTKNRDKQMVTYENT